MKLVLMGALLGVSAAAFAQCPGPDCPPKDAKARASSAKCPGPACPEHYEKAQIQTVADKCPGPGCPERKEHETAAAKPAKKSAKPAKKAETKQDWGHFSSGA
jgi:hypothetical protein